MKNLLIEDNKTLEEIVYGSIIESEQRAIERNQIQKETNSSIDKNILSIGSSMGKVRKCLIAINVVAIISYVVLAVSKLM